MADFILLPRSGVVAADTEPTANFLKTLSAARSTQAPLMRALQPGGELAPVVDSAGETGPKLVQMTPAEAAALNATSPDLRAAPVVIYKSPGPIPYQAKSSAASSSASTAGGPKATPFKVKCRVKGTNTPVPDCTVIAFDDFAIRSGDDGVTDANGVASLELVGPMIERLFVYSPPGPLWGAHRVGVAKPAAGGVVTVDIEPVDLTFVDAVRGYYPNPRFVPGAGVKVGVIDSGVGPHGHLNILNGTNTVTGEPANATADWMGHGTHVAGLIGANGAGPNGLRGMAPGVGIVPLRVFGQGQGGATNYAILKAMVKSAALGCDIINLSLGGGPYDPILAEGIATARNNGILVIIAAGNDGRYNVNYPAAYQGAVAVSAMGREGAFPAGSVYEGDLDWLPISTLHPDEFIAGFSNVGPKVQVTGLGVGVLSTLPGPTDPYGPMSGTSMAAPVVAGAAASLLSQNPAIMGMTRDAMRAAAIERLLLTSCERRGFGADYEGFGLPDPALV